MSNDIPLAKSFKITFSLELKTMYSNATYFLNQVRLLCLFRKRILATYEKKIGIVANYGNLVDQKDSHLKN